MTSGLDVLVFMYTCGVSGSVIGVILFKFPKNLNELFDRLTCCLLWPLDTYYAYMKSRARHQDIRLSIHLQNILVQQTTDIRRLTENLRFERNRYHKLLIDYKRLKAENEKTTSLNGAKILKLEAPKKHE